MIVSTSLHKTGTMDFEQGTGDMANLKIEEMYENLSNITKQLAIIQGFIESKYGKEKVLVKQVMIFYQSCMYTCINVDYNSHDVLLMF